MSGNVTIEDLASILKENRKAVLDEIASLKKEVKEIVTEHNSTITKIALLQRDVKENTNSLDKNWNKTRILEARILRWGGIITGLSLASGFIIKMAF